MDIAESLPDLLDVTGPKNSGPGDEKAVLKANLRAERTYLVDRWMGHVPTLDAIVAAGGDYVARLRDNIHWEALQARELTDEAVAAGVTFDAVVRVGTKTPGDHPMRVVILRLPAHPKRKPAVTKASTPRTEVRLVTNLLDLPAEMIGLLYRYRWTIKTFFGFFKQTLGCGHLFWDDPRGIRLQAYCALIAYLLIQQTSGRKPTKATFAMLRSSLAGWADWSEAEAHLARLKPVPASKTTSRGNRRPLVAWGRVAVNAAANLASRGAGRRPNEFHNADINADGSESSIPVESIDDAIPRAEQDWQIAIL